MFIPVDRAHRCGFSFGANTRGKAMLIECSFCQARYRMNESMMRGFKWAEVRCRKCAETIVVLTPVMRLMVLDASDPADRAFIPLDLRSSREHSSSADERGEPPRGRVRHGLPKAETKAQPKPAPEEETAAEPVPDNVYSLALFREIRPKRLPIGGFDISGCIRPEPLPLRAESKPAAPPPLPETEPKRPAIARSKLVDQPIEWRREGIAASRGAPSFPTSTKTDGPAKSSSHRARLRSRFSDSVQPHPLQIAIVYLVLLVLSGLGYLLVRYLSRLMSEAGG